MFNAPHGLICATLLPAAYRTNIQTLEKRAAESPALEKYHETARIITGSKNANPSDGLQWLNDLAMHLLVPGLEDFNIAESDFPILIEKAKNTSSMKGNPIALSDEELTGILTDSLRPPISGDSTLYL
jgi:alcohol dehydrogenase class IV